MAAVADVGGYTIREAVCEGIVKLMWPWQDAMPWNWKLPNVFQMRNIATHGCGSSLASIQMVPITCHIAQIATGRYPVTQYLSDDIGYYTALERTLFVGDVDDASLAIWNANVAAHEFGISLLKPGMSCVKSPSKLMPFRRSRFVAISHLWVRTFVWGAKPVLWPRGGIGTARRYRYRFRTRYGHFHGTHADHSRGQAGAGGYREHDILIITEDGNENITGYPYGPEFNVVV